MAKCFVKFNKNRHPIAESDLEKIKRRRKKKNIVFFSIIHLLFVKKFPPLLVRKRQLFDNTIL